MFQQAIPSSWSQASITAGKLATCARGGGREYESLLHRLDLFLPLPEHRV